MSLVTYNPLLRSSSPFRQSGSGQACGHSHAFFPVSYSGISVNIQDLAPSCAGFLFGEPLAYPYPCQWAVPGGWAVGAIGGSSHGVSLNVCSQVWPTLLGPWQVRDGSRSRLEVLLFLGLGQSGNELRVELKWGLPPSHSTQGLPSGIPKPM